MKIEDNEADYRLEAYKYDLPKDFIAQQPASPRDCAKLMILNRSGDIFAEDIVRNLDKYLSSDSLVVLNEVRVIPARFFARSETGGKVEVLIINFEKGNTAQALMQSRRPIRVDEHIYSKFPHQQLSGNTVESKSNEITIKVITPPGESGVRIIQGINCELTADLLEKIGQPPLPPYIHRKINDPRLVDDKVSYQTVYASKGSAVAAPTAGLHFTQELLSKLQTKFQLLKIILDVGPGTFQPVRNEDIRKHRMHSENYVISPGTAEAIIAARKAKRPIFAVGTTTVRALETAAQKHFTKESLTGASEIFIYPGFKFQIVDAIMTNFHLPGSTLIMMLSAFIGRKRILERYQDAVKKGYRFYSYGDAMLILPD